MLWHNLSLSHLIVAHALMVGDSSRSQSSCFVACLLVARVDVPTRRFVGIHMGDKEDAE